MAPARQLTAPRTGKIGRFRQGFFVLRQRSAYASSAFDFVEVSGETPRSLIHTH
jgi:hypothetical protein